MIVVADTSPINYLVLIEEIAILEELYSQVTIPHAVHAELVHSATPERVRSWIEQLPSWVEVRTPSGKSDGSLDKLNAAALWAGTFAFDLMW
jgi:predicted nucleic acid-binding protein